MISRSAFYTFLAVIFATLASPACLFAQDFDQWRQQREKEFQEFKDERDAAFLKMLQETWIEIEGREPDSDYEIPKSDQIPVADDPGGFFDSAGEPVRVITDLPEPSGIMDMPRVHLRNDIPAGANRSRFNFFELGIEYDYMPSEIIRLRGFPAQESMRLYWEQFSDSNYQVHLERLIQITTELNLNDWGVLKATRMLGESMYGAKGNDVSLFVWFMMTKMGYDVKAGYHLQHIYILFPSEYQINQMRFFWMNGRRYYIMPLDDDAAGPNTITTYQGSYPDTATLFNLDITKLPNLPQDIRERELSFQWEDEEFHFTIPYNYNLINYYRNFPATDFHVFTTASISGLTLRAFTNELGSVIEGRSKIEAVNILLRFVQTAFDYKTDTEQFGKQKYMLPEEILYYPFSDCDDRAILFAFLVRKLLNAELVGLLYPNHLATAVRMDEYSGGDTFHFNGSRYVVADPTFLYAAAGMSMPQFRGISPTIVPLFPD